MTSTTYPEASPHSGRFADRPSWFARAEAWMDSKGKGAWIAAMVLGLIFFWPIGLALLAYMIWSKRMFNSGKCLGGPWARHSTSNLKPTGNSAFESYKADTLARLEQEQKGFEEFLVRLREAKDKVEFDQFMAERSRAHAASDPTPAGEGAPGFPTRAT